MVHFGYNDCMTTKIKHDAAPIREYYAALQTYADHDAVHEGATETAFSNLLTATARPHGWTLIPKKGLVVEAERTAVKIQQNWIELTPRSCREINEENSIIP